MNKYLAIIIFTFTGIILPSCSEEFLIKEPYGITSENIFCNEKGIEALLTGTYSMIRGSALWMISWGASIQNWTYGSVASDDAYKGSENTDSTPLPEIEHWEVSTTNGYTADKWRWAFGLGIVRANSLLNVIRQTENLPEKQVEPGRPTRYAAMALAATGKKNQKCCKK